MNGTRSFSGSRMVSWSPGIMSRGRHYTGSQNTDDCHADPQVDRAAAALEYWEVPCKRRGGAFDQSLLQYAPEAGPRPCRAASAATNSGPNSSTLERAHCEELIARIRRRRTDDVRRQRENSKYSGLRLRAGARDPRPAEDLSARLRWQPGRLLLARPGARAGHRPRLPLQGAATASPKRDDAIIRT